MSEPTLVPGAIMVNPAKQIILNFVPTQVVGEVAMQLSYTNIPEGWGFVHQALCDALKQVGQLWAQSQRAVIVPPNGVRH